MNSAYCFRDGRKGNRDTETGIDEYMKKDKIIHFLPFDKKFVSLIINGYEENLPGKNYFFFHEGDRGNLPDNLKSDKIVFLNDVANVDEEIEKRRDECLFAIFHTYNPFMCSLFRSVQGKLPVVWGGWGYDFLIFSNVLTRKTWFEYFKASPLAATKQYFAKGLLGKLKYHDFYKTVSKIDYFGCILPGEYKKLFFIQTKKRKEFTYTVGYVSPSNSDSTGDNVLLAHSLSISCNHYNGIDLFHKYARPDQKGVMFLSYGQDSKFINGMKEYGRRKLGERLEIYSTFLSFEEYNRVIRSCSFAILPYLRQLGLACINRLFMAGAKIFLYEDSILYDFYKNRGFFVYSIEHDLKLKSNFSKLSSDEICVNREKVIECFGRQTQDVSCRAMYDFFASRNFSPEP